MGNGSMKNYKFGQKNHWRRTVWNEITRRVASPKDSLVLYLAGQYDLDRKVAVERGFRPDNMIVIERDPAVADKLREEGKITIKSDLLETLAGWQENGIPVGVIFADFCCGLEPSTISIYQAMKHKRSFWGSVALINFMRGRDPNSQQLRECFEDYFPEEDRKHRGLLYISTCALLVLNGAKYGDGKTLHKISDIEKSNRVRLQMNVKPPNGIEEEIEFLSLVGAFSPWYHSYKSGSLTMDSVVFESPMNKLSVEAKERINSCRADWKPKPTEATKQIAAALAIRTMRMNGQLSHSPAA